MLEATFEQSFFDDDLNRTTQVEGGFNLTQPALLIAGIPTLYLSRQGMGSFAGKPLTNTW